MTLIFNPFTRTFDFVGAGTGSTFDPNTILTGPTDCLYFGPDAPRSVLIDENGNVLTAP